MERMSFSGSSIGGGLPSSLLLMRPRSVVTTGGAFLSRTKEEFEEDLLKVGCWAYSLSKTLDVDRFES